MVSIAAVAANAGPEALVFAITPQCNKGNQIMAQRVLDSRRTS